MIILRMLRGHGIWNAGEIAGFPPARASEMIASGVAEIAAPEATALPPERSPSRRKKGA
jgi:hypothetical protein